MSDAPSSPIHPHLSVIVAVSENGVIGCRGELPWRLASDLQLFKRITMGHHLVMGRKTFESIGRILPGRTTVVLTRSRDWQAAGAVIARTWAEVARVIAADDEPFVVGGAELYRQILPVAARLYLTRVHAAVAGDAYFDFPEDHWRLLSAERFEPTARDDYPFTWQIFERIAAHPRENGESVQSGQI